MSNIFINMESDEYIHLKKSLKYMEYGDYIREHRANVQKAYEMLKDYFSNWIVNEIGSRGLEACIRVHDVSKFYPTEFIAYRRHFFPIDEAEKEKEAANPEAFQRACKHHYKFNPHHPEYWIDADGTKHNMDIASLCEMICDLWAMSFKFHNTPLQYIKSKGDEFKDMMSRNSYDRLICMLEDIDKKGLIKI